MISAARPAPSQSRNRLYLPSSFFAENGGMVREDFCVPVRERQSPDWRLSEEDDPLHEGAVLPLRECDSMVFWL
jgi:hypothetical protein